MLNLETESKYFNLGYKLIGGVDEAGRGPLAGPVVAACVVIGPDFKIDSPDLELVADSKALTAKKREHLFGIIKTRVLAVEIGVVNNTDIDKINILQASFLAMRRAIRKLAVQPDYILLDGGFKIPKLDKPQTAIVKGDATVWAIAAASIIAKVSRDWLMAEIDQQYPQYGFAQHKGYGTKLHFAKIAEYGPCPLHRCTFSPIKEMVTKK
jgi:ribonuclease HII